MSKDLVTSMRNELIEARTKEEQKISEFAKAISSIDVKEVFGDIYIPDVISLREFCPEAYKDTPDVDVYTIQYNEMVKVFDSINKRILEYNSDALECLKQFKAMK